RMSGGRWRFPKDEVKEFLCGDRVVPHHIIGMDFEGGLMGSSEASKALGVNRKTLYRLVKDGRLPATKVAGVWRFIRNEVNRYLIKRRYSLGIYTARPLFFWSYVLDKYRNDPQTYYIKDSAYDGFVGSRKDYYEYQTLVSMHRVKEGDRFFVELHYRKVPVKGGVILVLTNKQVQSIPVKEQNHWMKCELTEDKLKAIEL
ncbi:MAG: helix-turn-helix domain-containing protein, partial [Planctomycetota bacterium]|nr:helix-turn-helix domain-containing protein [Planctomycetota bacterium]